MRRLARALASVGLLLVLTFALAAGRPGLLLAQDALPPPPDRERRSELWDKSDEELAEEGWEFRSADRTPGSVGCGLAAIVVSLVWRGWGHRCARDDDSHDTLLIMQGVSVGLIGVAITIAILSNDADALNPVWSGLFYGGMVLFASTYVFDLLGTFKGSARSLYPNLRQTDGITPRAILRVAFDDPFGLNVIGGLEVPMQYGFFWFRPEALVELQNADFWRAGGDLGFRVWQGEAHATWLGLGALARYESFRESGFEVLTTIPYVAFSLDVGDLLPQLGELFFVNRLGYGYELYAWDAVETEDLFKDTSSIFILESELSMNFLENFNFTVTYRSRPDTLVGGLARPDRLFDVIPTPGIGILGFDLSFLQEDGLDVNIEFNIGTLAEIWIGAGKQF